MEAWTGGYARRSRALGDPDNDPSVLESQVASIRRLALQDGQELSGQDVRLEVGSGEHIETRPVFRELLAGWERLPRRAGGLLYVTEVTRLSRGDLTEFGRIEGALRRAAIQVATCGRRYDLEREEDRFMFRLEALFANKEYDRAKERLDRGRREKRQKGGLANGVPPFGYLYSREEQTLLPHPERFLILRRCCHEALTISVKRLAVSYGVPENCLLRALRNPTICGWPARHYGPKDPDNPSRQTYVPVPRAQWDWPEFANSHYPHACSRDEWEGLQLALDRRRDTRARTHKLDGWCRDILQFEAAPGPVHLGSLVASQRKSGNVLLLTYQRKEPNEKLNKKHTTLFYAARDTVHDACFQAVQSVFSRPRFLRRAISDYQAERADREKQRSREQDQDTLGRSLADARRRYHGAVDAEADAESALHRQALTLRRRRLEETVGRLENEWQVLQSRSEEPAALSRLAPRLADFADRFAVAWERADGNERRELVNVSLCLAEVTITPAPTPQPYRREVTRIDYQPWLRPYFGECAR